MNAAAFQRSAFAVSVVLTLSAFFVPLVLVWSYEDVITGGVTRGAQEATVGIGVILRATARRLARTGSSNILRTSFGAYARAAARALTRRMLKMASRVAVASVTKDVVDRERELSEEPARTDGPIDNVLGVAIGFIGLFCSFYGILHIVSPGDVASLTTDQGISHVMAATLGASPILLYAVLNLSAGKIFGVRVQLRTAFDGLLLQGYFTGAGSFLPMTTDVDYQGETKQKAKTAASALAGLFVVYLLLAGIGLLTGNETASFASTTFLLYCFVCSFPIKPLEGYELWQASKLLWALLWLPILSAFVMSLPSEFGAIL